MREPPNAGASLYRRLGGHEPLVAIADVFSRRVAADGELAPFVTGRDPEGLRRHQVAVLRDILGGPRDSQGATVDPAHAGLGLPVRLFELISDHLAAALRSCGVPEALGAEVLRQVALWREQFAEAEQ